MESDQAELLTTISFFLEEHRIPYMITGAWSVIFYGRPRASHDIDFVVELYEKDTEKVLADLRSLPNEYSVQSEAVRLALKGDLLFQIIHLPTYLKLDFWLLTNDSFDQSRFLRRQRVQIFGQRVAIASMEDTILQKLRWYKEAPIEKHLVDAAFVYQMQTENLDQRYLARWAKRLDVTKFLKKLQTIDLGKYL